VTGGFEEEQISAKFTTQKARKKPKNHSKKPKNANILPNIGGDQRILTKDRLMRIFGLRAGVGKGDRDGATSMAAGTLKLQNEPNFSRRINNASGKNQSESQSNRRCEPWARAIASSRNAPYVPGTPP